MRHFDKANAAHLYLARDILRWGGEQHFPLAADDGVIVADELCPTVDKQQVKVGLSAAAPSFNNNRAAVDRHFAAVQHFRRSHRHTLTPLGVSLGYSFPVRQWYGCGHANLEASAVEHVFPV